MKKFEDLKIAVAGTGYVGLSIATLLSQKHQVVAVDVIPEKVEKINNRISPIQDEYIEKYFAEKELNLTSTLDGASAYKDADYVVIAAPTNYDPAKNFFDTHHIEDVIDLVLSVNPNAVMVIKSTIPVGYCQRLYARYGQINLLFSPEFLRESKALEDNLWPSRIIVGYPKLMNVSDEYQIKMKECAEVFAHLLQEGAIKENIDTLFRMQRASYSARDAYDTFCKELEQCLPFVFGCSSTLPEPAPDATDERLLLRSTILSAANKIYLDCCFDALRQEQALWEDILPDLA